MNEWSISQSQDLYNINRWSDGYFSVNQKGHVEVHPNGKSDHAGIDLYELCQQFRKQGIRLPVLVRFTDILEHRVARLTQAFEKALQVNQYQGNYTPVYPIKVNQQHSVVEHLLNNTYHPIGLEAGSKPELMAVLGIMSQRDGTIVCNGYKDREYIRLALIGQQMGHQVFIVIEKLSELETVIRESLAMNIRPRLGIRIRLASIGAGQWQNSGGEKSKFGLSASQVLDAVARLKQAGLQDCLSMLHFHLGSQLANIRDIQRGMRECARFYVELHQLGIDIRYADVGGGLGVDYEGTQSRHTYSINYSLEGYASSIVQALLEVCDQHGISQPNIMTESGRAMTAHHAVLITNVIDIEKMPRESECRLPEPGMPAVIRELWNCYTQLGTEMSSHQATELYHEIVHHLAEIHEEYSKGSINLTQRAYAEQVYFTSCHIIRDKIHKNTRSHDPILDELNEKLSDKYFCNFSLFQSMPDVWAIEQIFPVMPLHRLQQQPTRRGVIEDITCDSDGRIDHYVDGEGVTASLSLHELQKDEEYLLGMFLVGAYQEILGDMHNLFGDTDSVHVTMLGKHEYRISELIQGDTVDDVLCYVHFNSQKLLDSYRHKLENSQVNPALQQAFYHELEQGIHGYTYLED